jgi:cytochrome P450
MEERVREIADRLLDGVAGQQDCDFMGRFAAQLPSLVIGAMIGVPEEHRGEFLECTEGMIETGPNAHPIEEPAAKIFAQFKTLLDLRRQERRGDLMSALLDAEVEGERLSEEEVLGFCFLLLVGGNDTTMNLIGNGIALLAQHPDQRAELVDDPSLIPEAIEEMLRFESPTQALPRRPTRNVELQGVAVPANCRLIVNYGSANHDERFFEDPERFDIHRRNKQHLALGQGSHFCMGASLARLEARIAFETLLARYPEYELSVEPGWVTSRWARSHPELRIDLGPRASER